MASIMKRGSTYSVDTTTNHAGKPLQGLKPSRPRPKRRSARSQWRRTAGQHLPRARHHMTVEEMLYKWIPIQSSKHKWSPKTYTQSVAMVQNLIVPYVGKRKVQDLPHLRR